MKDGIKTWDIAEQTNGKGDDDGNDGDDDVDDVDGDCVMMMMMTRLSV